MRIVQTLADEQAKFRLTYLHLKDGRTLPYAGPDLTRALRERTPLPLPISYWAFELQDFAAEHGLDIDAVSTGPNIVFEATLRAQGGRLTDVDENVPYRAADGAVIRILEAAIDGRLRQENGTIRGLFTFRSLSRKVTLDLWRDQAPLAAAPAGAPDLSDFIKTLGTGA